MVNANLTDHWTDGEIKRERGRENRESDRQSDRRVERDGGKESLGGK